MNLNRQGAMTLAKGLAEALDSISNVEVAICPPAVYLSEVAVAISGTSIGLGAQNMYHVGEGAFTGEISPLMLRDLGCQFVILGHSERRQFFGETDATVNAKTQAALANSITPIVCVGETLEQREAGSTASVIEEQIRGSLAGLSADQGSRLVIAYEPVWAIGTGRTASPSQAEEVHSQIRQLLSSLFGSSVADLIRLQYGGSVKPENAAELMSQPNIDGALVGGASLKVDSFEGIIRAAG